MRKCLPSGLELQVWDEQHLLGMLRERFEVQVEAITAENLLDVRQTIDQAKGYHAFGGPSLAEYEHDPLNAALTWHFGFWRLRQLREPHQKTPAKSFRPEHTAASWFCSATSVLFPAMYARHAGQ